MAKLGPDAFDLYIGLGPSRSYEAVAQHFGASKKAVSKRATKERWQERLAEIEHNAAADADKKATESIKGIISRHLKLARWIQARAIETLKEAPLRSTADALRALEFSLKEERHLARTDDPNAAEHENPFEGLSPEFLKQLHKEAHEYVHNKERQLALEADESIGRTPVKVKPGVKLKGSPEP